MGDDDPHEVLGVCRNASQEEVREAYRSMVKEHHPDVSDAPDAEERFLRIRNAYEEMYEEAGEREGRKKKGPGRNDAEGNGDSYTSDSSEKGNGTQDFSYTEKVYEGSGSYGDSTWTGSSVSSSEGSTRDRDYRTWAEGDTDTERRRRRDRGRGSNNHEAEGVRVEGLRGGWEILRNSREDGEEVNWFVHRPRNGYYLDGDSKRTRSRHGFGSRSEAREAYREYRGSDERKRPGPHSKDGFRVVERLDDMWRLASGPKGFAIVSHTHPLTFLDDSGEVAIQSQWFGTEEEARNAHNSRNEREKPGMSRRTRILLAPFLIPFFATLAVLNAVGGSESTGSKSYSVYVSGVVSTTFLTILAYATESFLIAGFATANLVLLCVLILSPYEMPNE